MERITSHQVVGLMEAYVAVHTPQINEEQVWEEVESWVNSLLEEGYDLSEYTWEEMYEHYLSEAIGQPGSAGMVNWQDKNSGQVRSGYKSSSDGKLYKNYNDALAAKNSRMGGLAVQQGIERTFRAGGGNAAVAQGRSPLAVVTQGSTNLQRQQRPVTAADTSVPRQQPVPASRPAAPAPTAARPAAPAPTAAKPAMGPTGNPLVGGIERRTPTSAELKAAQAARAGGGALAQATAAASKPAAFNPTPTASTPTPAARPATPTKPTPRQVRLNMEMEYDTFDTVLEYLVSEGYADTEEAALQIMANMSEEWRESIVEGLASTLIKGAVKVAQKAPAIVKDAKNTMGYYTKNPEQALPFLVPAAAAAQANAKKQKSAGK